MNGLFGLVGLVFVLLVVGVGILSALDKTCPRCRKKIHRRATKCPYCQSELPAVKI
jgi:predicted amidophosphoribosyltransferase